MKEKTVGIVRYVDEMRRVVLPRELRQTMGLKYGDRLEFSTEGRRIILKKYARVCAFCGRTERRVMLREFCGKLICKRCTEKVRKELE